MSSWEHLLTRTDLTDAELKKVPSVCCVNYITMKNYFQNVARCPAEELLDGIEVSDHFFSDPRNWLNPIDALTFRTNAFRHSKGLLTHHDFRNAGMHFTFSENSLFMILFKLIPISVVLSEMKRNVRKFNNEYEMETIKIGQGKVLIKISDYPYLRNLTTGGECRFVEGVFGANFEMHQIKNYSVKHLICGKTIANIVKYAYKHRGLAYREDASFVYINDHKIGRLVTLKVHSIGKVEIFNGEIIDNEESGKALHGNAVQILEDFAVDGRTLFYKGEIYNAPYCVQELAWKEPAVAKRIVNAFRNKVLFERSIEEIEKQIEFSNRKLFELMEALAESERRLGILEVYTRKNLVQKIKQGFDPTEFKPEHKNMAVLFSDIRNFTSISESMQPLETVQFLNEFFNLTNEVIQDNMVEVDKLIGDCVMAGFSDPEKAIDASIEIKRRLVVYNAKCAEENRPLIKCGLGISYGTVVVGNIGSENKMDYTLIGNTVNVASRLQSLTKVYGVGICISEDVLDKLGDRAEQFEIRFLDLVQVKGKRVPIKIFEVFDYEPDFVKAKKYQIQERLMATYDLYETGYLDESYKLLLELMAMVGRHRFDPARSFDPLLDFYKARIERVRLSPMAQTRPTRSTAP